VTERDIPQATAIGRSPGYWRHLCAVAALVLVTACATHGPARAAPEGEAASVFRPGDNIAGKYLAGRHAESIGNYAAAVDLTRDVLDALPDDETLLVRTHLLLISVGRIEEAVVLARRIVARKPDDALGNMMLSLAAIHDGKYDDALASLDRLQLERANRILVPLLRAWTLAGKGDGAAALAALDAFNVSGDFTVISGLHGGMIAELAGDDVAAAAAYARAAAAAGDQVPLQIVRSFSRFLARTGRTDEAKALVAGFEARNPSNLLIEPVRTALDAGTLPEAVAATAQAGAGQALRAVADLLHRESGENSALVFIRLALFLKPGDDSMQSLLAGILNAQNRHDDAIAVFRSIDPASPYAWYGKLDIANALRAGKRDDEAIALLREMVEQRPERAEAARALGDFLRFSERYKEAVAAYDTAIRRTVDAPDWRLHYSRGIVLERLKEWPPAEKDFLLALQLEPDQPLVLNYLGYSWVEQGIKLDEAKAMIKKAVELRPRDGYITDSLGWVLYRLGDYTDAVEWLERAVSLVPGDPTINDHLGDAYWLVGRRQEAGFQWHRALSLDPDADLKTRLQLKVDGKERPKPLPPGERRDI
jgi:tetratricopeptide (TPR) repeat protein